MAGAATALALIGTSLTGFDRHVFGWENWPGPGPVDIASQILPGIRGSAPEAQVLKVRQSARGTIVIPASIPATSLAGVRRGAATFPSGSEAVSLSRPVKDALAGPSKAVGDAKTTSDGGGGVVGQTGDTWTSGAPTFTASPDSDHDGLSDAVERRDHTDPYNEDTDADGLPDGWEASHGLDPRSGGDQGLDPDHDGLTNKTEFRTLTDPQAAQTDPGVPDGAQDYDHDGVPNGVEQELKTDPALTDSGGQGVDDGAVDSDGDGFTNAEEVSAGTDPADPASHAALAPKPPLDDPSVVDPGSAPITDVPVDDTTVGPKPTPVDPAPVDPGTGTTDPAPADPGLTDPGTGTTDPVPADPVPADPGLVDPGPTDPAPAPEPPAAPKPSEDPAPVTTPADPVVAAPDGDEPACDDDADDPPSCTAPVAP